MEKKKILFICSNHFPYDGANGKLLKNLLDGGLSDAFEVHVLTHMFVSSDRTLEEYDKYTVHRFFSWFMYPKNHLMNYIKLNYHFGDYMRLLFKKVLPKLKSQDDKQFFMSKQYIDDITSNLEKLNSQYHFDVVVSIVAGFETVKATLNFQKKHEDIPVVVYQLDPCSDNELENIESFQERKELEKEYLTKANAIITTPIITEFYKKNYPVELTNKVVSMEFPNVVPVEQNYKYNPDKIICLFAGNIYRGIRNPDYTLKLFGALEDTNIELHILGSCDEPIKKELLKKNIKFFDSVSSKEAEELINKANILVNIGNSMTNQVPSKIFEYISTGKPIINIYKNENCPTLPYFEKYEYVCNIIEKDILNIDDLERMRLFIVENSHVFESSESILHKYEESTITHCAMKFITIIKEVFKKEGE